MHYKIVAVSFLLFILLVPTALAYYHFPKEEKERANAMTDEELMKALGSSRGSPYLNVSPEAASSELVRRAQAPRFAAHIKDQHPEWSEEKVKQAAEEIAKDPEQSAAMEDEIEEDKEFWYGDEWAGVRIPCMLIFLAYGMNKKGIDKWTCIWLLGLLGFGQQKTDPYADLVGSLNDTLLNQKISDKVKATTGLPLIKNEKINVNVFTGDQTRGANWVGITIKDGIVVKISEGRLSDATTNVYLPAGKLDAILKARTTNAALLIALSSIRDGSIRLEGVGTFNAVKVFAAQRSAVIYSKFRSYPFDVKKGETRTVNFAGTKARLEQNALGQRMVSVADSKVVYRVSRSGEVLGYSTAGTQKLIAAGPPQTSGGGPPGGGIPGGTVQGVQQWLGQSFLSPAPGYYGTAYGLGGCIGSGTYRYYDVNRGIMIDCPMGTPTPKYY